MFIGRLTFILSRRIKEINFEKIRFSNIFSLSSVKFLSNLIQQQGLVTHFKEEEHSVMGSLSRWLTRNQPRRQQHDSGTTPIDSSWRACSVRRTDSCITRACGVKCYQNFDCNLDTGYITVEQQSRTIALLRNGAQTRVSRFLFFFFCTRKRISIALEFRVGERIHTSTSNLYGSSCQKNKHFCNFIQVV